MRKQDVVKDGTPPGTGWVKLNIDASVTGNKAMIGGVFRDEGRDVDNGVYESHRKN